MACEGSEETAIARICEGEAVTSLSKPTYALKKIIARAVDAAKDAGLEIGGVEVLSDGTVRVLTKDSVKSDAFSDWKRRAG